LPEFSAYERLFALWHVLHIPLFFMLVLAGICMCSPCTSTKAAGANAVRHGSGAVPVRSADAVAVAPVGAGKVETLVMPGPVTAAHAKFETECRKCHELFSRASQNQLCLSCHKDVAAICAPGPATTGARRALTGANANPATPITKGAAWIS